MFLESNMDYYKNKSPPSPNVNDDYSSNSSDDEGKSFNSSCETSVFFSMYRDFSILGTLHFINDETFLISHFIFTYIFSTILGDKIRVGKDYQAVVPDMIPEEGSLTT